MRCFQAWNHMPQNCSPEPISRQVFDCGGQRDVLRHQHIVKRRHDIVNEYDVVHELDVNHYDIVNHRNVVRNNDFRTHRPDYCGGACRCGENPCRCGGNFGGNFGGSHGGWRGW
jgi:hypothetical protein